MIGNDHNLVGYNTPICKPTWYNISCRYRNGLTLSSDDGQDKVQDTHVVSDMKPQASIQKVTSSLDSHTMEVKQLLLQGSANSPVDENKVNTYTKIAQKDTLALDILQTTHSYRLTPKETEERLVTVLGNTKSWECYIILWVRNWLYIHAPKGEHVAPSLPLRKEWLPLG